MLTEREDLFIIWTWFLKHGQQLLSQNESEWWIKKKNENLMKSVIYLVINREKKNSKNDSIAKSCALHIQSRLSHDVLHRASNIMLKMLRRFNKKLHWLSYVPRTVMRHVMLHWKNSSSEATAKLMLKEKQWGITSWATSECI